MYRIAQELTETTLPDLEFGFPEIFMLSIMCSLRNV